MSSTGQKGKQLVLSPFMIKKIPRLTTRLKFSCPKYSKTTPTFDFRPRLRIMGPLTIYRRFAYYYLVFSLRYLVPLGLKIRRWLNIISSKWQKLMIFKLLWSDTIIPYQNLIFDNPLKLKKCSVHWSEEFVPKKPWVYEVKELSIWAWYL